MSGTHPNSWVAPAVRIVGAGLGAAVAGPLGGALGGWLGDFLGAPAAAIIQEYAKKFGENAAEKLLDVGSESLTARLKESSPPIEGAYREALRLSLKEVHSQTGWDGFDDWFTNWERCLAAPAPLDLSSIELGQLVPAKLDGLFQRTMECLDAQGAALLQKDLSITLRCRVMPDALLSELTSRLPERLRSNFNALIVTPKYDEAWKQSQIIFQQFAHIAVQRIDETTQRIERATDVLPQVADDTAAIRKILADFKVDITQQIASQAATKQRKTWRDLSHLLVPMIGGVSEGSDDIFISELCTGLDDTFGNRQYSQFTGLLRYVERNVDGQTVPFYYLLCHQIEFCESVRRTIRLLIRSYQNAKKQGREAVVQLMEERQKVTDAFNYKWDSYTSFDLSHEWLPLEFTVDAARGVISIQSLPLSVDPSEYASGIISTSEVLRFLASCVNAGPVVYLGDFMWYKDNYSLLKLWVHFIDHGKIEIDRLRINAEDYEEWDYVNPLVDLEIKNSEKQQSPKAR